MALADTTVDAMITPVIRRLARRSFFTVSFLLPILKAFCSGGILGDGGILLPLAALLALRQVQCAKTDGANTDNEQLASSAGNEVTVLG